MRYIIVKAVKEAAKESGKTVSKDFLLTLDAFVESKIATAVANSKQFTRLQSGDLQSGIPCRTKKSNI